MTGGFHRLVQLDFTSGRDESAGSPRPGLPDPPFERRPGRSRRRGVSDLGPRRAFRTATWRRLSTLLLVTSAFPRPCDAQASPDTDIWVFPFSESPLTVDVASGYRATQRRGYDNQPAFLPGGKFLLFTAIDETGQADIYRFDLRGHLAEPVIQTFPESEYSATPVPGNERISVIRVEADSTQRLWTFDLAGGTPEVLLPDLQPVGYHAWIDDDRLAVFILGSPATLQVASLAPGRSATVAARDIGRSLHRIPKRGTVSYVQLRDGMNGIITELDPETGETSALAPVLQGNEFHAWTPAGVLLSGEGSRLFRWVEGSDRGWVEVADLGRMGVRGISRIAVSPEGDRIAVVGVAG